MKSHRRRRVAPLIWISGGLSAVLLILGVNGTLSSWTQATITNDSNTVQAADSLILQETGPGNAVCNSTDGGGSGNTFTCSTIDKYGGIAVPLGPGDHQSVTVSLKNTGTVSGQLDLAPGTCVATGGSATASASICDVADVTVSCTAPSALDTTLTPVALSSFPSATVVVSLPKNTATDCTFDVTVPADATPQIAGQVATQPLVWTLS
ncbi:MAG TPA: hypothetical protein VN088_03650 [Nocardioides sp.]|nr:hypothetical protein [Nocardioides sp.]